MRTWTLDTPQPTGERCPGCGNEAADQQTIWGSFGGRDQQLGRQCRRCLESWPVQLNRIDHKLTALALPRDQVAPGDLPERAKYPQVGAGWRRQRGLRYLLAIASMRWPQSSPEAVAAPDRKPVAEFINR